MKIVKKNNAGKDKMLKNESFFFMANRIIQVSITMLFVYHADRDLLFKHPKVIRTLQKSHSSLMLFIQMNPWRRFN